MVDLLPETQRKAREAAEAEERRRVARLEQQRLTEERRQTAEKVKREETAKGAGGSARPAKVAAAKRVSRFVRDEDVEMASEAGSAGTVRLDKESEVRNAWAIAKVGNAPIGWKKVRRYCLYNHTSLTTASAVRAVRSLREPQDASRLLHPGLVRQVP